MTEYSNILLEEITSDLIVFTNQLLPKSSCDAHTNHKYMPVKSSGYRVPIRYYMRCGSSEEFYIRPMNPCIADADALCYRTNQLAFVEDTPELPHDVSFLADEIECYQIEPYLRYPGFVRLRVLGNMNFNWKHKIYEFSLTTIQNRYIKIDLNAEAAELFLIYERFGELPNTVSGPAITIQIGTDSQAHMYDGVGSMWCPQWPKEAQDWSKRLRGNGWPTINTISEVVQQGCHVVYVQHRACRNDVAQWRYSFSVAEVILIQSWPQIQQIVYHLLRFFSKRELIQKHCPKEDEVLCTYHLKTLMLWTCEWMSAEWWTSSSVIAICSELLKMLLEWLKKRYCPNYFIPKANLFHEQWTNELCEKSERQLDKFCNSDILCIWFVENYILPFTLRYYNVEVISKATPHFLHYMLPLLEFRKSRESKSLDLLFSIGFANCNKFACTIVRSEPKMEPRCCLRYSCTARKMEMLIHCEMSILPIPENIRCLTYFDRTLYSLNAAYDLKYGQISWDSELFADYVKGIFMRPKIVRCQYHIFPKPLTEEISQFQFLRAQDLMENITGLSNRVELQLLTLLSKKFLSKALECNDSPSNVIAPAALVYLAALHFATSEHQRVMDLCSAVLINQNTHQETLDASCLFFIDDVVSIVGLCLLFKKLNEKMHYSKRQIYLDLRLTPEVFAHHLTVISTEGISRQWQLNPNSPNSPLPLDQLLLVLTKRKSCRSTLMRSRNSSSDVRQCVYRRTASLTENAILRVNRLIGEDKIIDALMEFALENITSFYSAIRTDFGIQSNTADCYRALYLYKYHKYDEVLHLCERILEEPDLRSDLKDLAFANILVLPPLDSLCDGDVQCLFGFHTLFYYLSPLNDDNHNFDLSAESTLVRFIAGIVHSKLEQLSESLIGLNSIKYQYFLGRHFLARYLKLRCCIDCDHPFAEAMDDFAVMKSNLPFEHIIRRFILRKLHQRRNHPRVSSHRSQNVAFC